MGFEKPAQATGIHPDPTARGPTTKPSHTAVTHMSPIVESHAGSGPESVNAPGLGSAISDHPPNFDSYIRKMFIKYQSHDLRICRGCQGHLSSKGTGKLGLDPLHRCSQITRLPSVSTILRVFINRFLFSTKNKKS